MYGEIPVLKVLCGNDQFAQKSGNRVSRNGQWSSLQSIFSGVAFDASKVIREPCSTSDHEPLMGSGAKRQSTSWCSSSPTESLYAYIIVYLHCPPYIGFATFIRFSTETWPGLAYLARPRATAGTPQWVLPCVQPGQTQDAQDQRGKPYVMWSCEPPL